MEPNERLYKIISSAGAPVNGGTGLWPLNGSWTPPLKGPVVICKNGYHLTNKENVLYWAVRGGRLDIEVWHAEGSGEHQTDWDIQGDKIAFERARLVKKMVKKEDWRLLGIDAMFYALPILRLFGIENITARYAEVQEALLRLRDMTERGYPIDAAQRQYIREASYKVPAIIFPYYRGVLSTYFYEEGGPGFTVDCYHDAVHRMSGLFRNTLGSVNMRRTTRDLGDLLLPKQVEALNGILYSRLEGKEPEYREFQVEWADELTGGLRYDEYMNPMPKGKSPGRPRKNKEVTNE